MFDSQWEQLNNEWFLVGSPMDIVRDIRRYQESMDHLVIRTQFPSLKSPQVHQSLELFSEEVIPAVA